MQISFSDITPNGLRKIIKDVGAFVELGVVFKTPPVADITLVLVNESIAALDGNVKAEMQLNCGRCGQPVVFELDTDYSYTFRLGDDSSLLKKEVEFSDEECCTVYLDEPIINITEVLQEQLTLSIPEKLLCSKDCKGLCHKCGAMLSTSPCNCVVEDSDSPFAILKKMKR